MSPGRAAAAVVAVLAGAVSAAGCGLGPGAADRGEATLTVTRDYGVEPVIGAVLDDPGESETVLRALDREAEITTRHGGGFVQSIEGIAGGTEGGRSFDWFFYVNGIESAVGAAEAGVRPGDRVWWDHHDWTDVMRVPAAVGSFPQPFESAFVASGEPIEIGCAATGRACETARSALEREGIEAEVVAVAKAGAGERPRLLVGELGALATDRTARFVLDGPEASGVFARAAGEGEESELELLDAELEVREGGELGLIAATAAGDRAPTWVITGTDRGLVAAAAELLDAAALRDRFALAVDSGGQKIPVPVAVE